MEHQNDTPKHQTPARSIQYMVHPVPVSPTIHWLAIATDNLSTKFEVSISTHYEDMKNDTKRRKWGGLG